MHAEPCKLAARECTEKWTSMIYSDQSTQQPTQEKQMTEHAHPHEYSHSHHSHHDHEIHKKQHHGKPTWHNPMLRDMFNVMVISNPVRYRKRPELFYKAMEMCENAGINTIIVELAFGDRPHMVTSRDNILHLQLRSHEEFWHKENLINLGIAHGRRLFPHAKYVSWIDGDCRPARTPRDWFEETWHELQHYKFVQMWSDFQALDHNHRPVGGINPSFMYNVIEHGSAYADGSDSNGYPIKWGSPGLAWAAEIRALDEIGGLPDKAILGAGDWYLAHMLTSTLDIPTMHKYSEGYRHYWKHIQKLCDRHIKQDVGYVRGLVYHDWHGHTVNRGYNTRERVLIKYKFDPSYDIKRDHQGLYQMETYEQRQVRMYAKIRHYFRARNEDEI